MTGNQQEYTKNEDGTLNLPNPQSWDEACSQAKAILENRDARCGINNPANALLSPLTCPSNWQETQATNFLTRNSQTCNAR